MNIPWSDIASFSAAALSAVAAAGSWKAARRANATADSVAGIERERWHADLTPQFRIAIEQSDSGHAKLDVQLVGPLPLHHLDRVSMVIASSDDLDRTPRLAGSRTQEETDAQVWGPYRFTHGADGANVTGHSVRPFPLQVGRGRPFSIERTRPPHWQEGLDVNARWLDQWSGKPLRLVLTCTRAGFEPWTVPYDVEAPPSPRMRWL